MVTNTSDSTDDGSLRWAIQKANSDTNSISEIDFQIPTTGVSTIKLLTALPPITHPTIIDGSKQNGYSRSPLIELDCSALRPSDTGLLITAGSSTVRALAINNCPGTAIELSSYGANLIAGCYVGTTPDGTQARSNNLGILISGSSNNTIGGTGAHDMNLISGNLDDGIRITSSTEGSTVTPSLKNLIVGNQIGTDGAGTKAVPNGNDGIELTGSPATTIGGTPAGARNIISGNRGNGINFASGPANGTVVEGNYIGTDITGTLNLGNAGTGILLGSSQVMIGGTDAGAGNIIAHNKGNVSDPGDGIRFGSKSDQCSILSNSIFDNAGLGINFGSGPTANHSWPPGVTAGSGPNDYQNYPLLSSVACGSGNTVIKGTLNAAPNSEFTVQFFSSSKEDPSGYGEGQNFLGSTTVTTDNTGNGSFSALLKNVTLPGDSFITATATDSSGNTSEFSAGIQPKDGNIADLSITGSASADSAPVSEVYAGQSVTYSFSITNNGPQDAHDVAFVDTLPAGVSYQGSFKPPGTDLIVSGQQISAKLGALHQGDSVTLSFAVQFQTSAGSSVTNLATVSTSDADPNSSNDTAPIKLKLSPGVNLQFTQFTVAPDSLEIGSPLVYSIGVTNTGPSPATNVTLASPLEPGVSFVRASVAPAVTAPISWAGVVGSNVVVNLGTMLAGASTTVTIMVTPSLIGDLTATATISSTEHDLDPPSETKSITSTVLDKVGTIQFGAASYTVTGNAGQAVITVNRVGGTRGAVTVDYSTQSSTQSINAVPGLDFTPVSGTLVFPSEVMSQTITVPVFADPYDSHDKLVSIVLSNVQTRETIGKAILGSPSTATLTIQQIDSDTNPLAVTAVQWAGTAQSIRPIYVTFNKPLSSSTATNPASYSLVNVGPDGKYGTRDDSPVSLGPPTYNPTNRTVTLMPARPLPANRFFHLQILGAGGGGVQDIWGKPLAGDGTTPGTDNAVMLAQGTNLRYVTPLGDQVSLSISGGGMIKDLLSGTGEGNQLTVVGAVPHRTVLSGSVRKSGTGTGWAYLGRTIYGLGQFGDVRVRLSSPPFQVGQYPFSPGSTASSTLKTLTQPDTVTKTSPIGTAKTAAAKRAATPILRPRGRFHRSGR